MQYRVQLILIAVVAATITATAVTATAVDTSKWMLIEPGIGFKSLECDYKLCWVQFAMTAYANEIWQYRDHIWVWGLYIPGYTPKPYNLGIGVWNGNATVVLVTSNLIRIVVEAPAGAKSTLLLYGVQPYRIKCNGEDITPRGVPDLRALNNSGLAWLHTGQVLYLRATHHSPVIWDIQLQQIPESQPNETQTPIAILPYFQEQQENTTTPPETITLTQQEAYSIYTIIAIAVTATAILAGITYLRKRT